MIPVRIKIPALWKASFPILLDPFLKPEFERLSKSSE